MALKQRITELMEQLSVGIPEREYCIQLAFLTMIIGEPFYIYGRSGSGKGIILDRLIAAFKDAKALKVGRRQQEVPSKLNAYDINVFKSYYIPEAYMELRQGLGRLLRTENDSGKVLILDNRVVTEAYGKTFARIWNMKHVTANTVDDVKRFVS